MLQFGKNSTLNHEKYRFVAYSICYFGHGASFARFHLTAVCQCDHHASVQVNGQVVLFDQLRGNKAMAGATVHQSCNSKWLDQLPSFETG